MLEDSYGDELVWPYLPDAFLRPCILSATGGRASRAALSGEGMECARLLILSIMCSPDYYDDPMEPDDDLAEPELRGRIQMALNIFLNEIRKRVGNRPGAWLNNWGFIAIRFAAAFRNGGGVFQEIAC